jgi:hypothetical protein
MSDEGRRIPREFERELVHTETLVVEMREQAGRALSGQSRNISLTGIFVEAREPLEVGTEVQLFIGSLSSASALRAMAKVVHVVPGEGFGAHFIDESTEAREFVAAFIKRFRKR